MTFTAVEQLRFHYHSRISGALAQSLPVAGFTSNTVPWEILRAAGFFPLLLSPPRAATPHADEYMESVFDGRIRAIFEHLLAGDWPFLHTLFIPRTSEQEHKLFLYLREVARQEPARMLPRVSLFNLLHAMSPEGESYGLERTRELAREYPSIADSALRQAIVESNSARSALRSLLALRPERILGSEALPLIGAYYLMDRAEYAALATQAASELAAGPLLLGPRLLLKGSMLDHPHLHRVLESYGAIVAAEDDWWGSRAGGADISLDADPIAAIFDHYYRNEPSPRVFPPAAADAWFLHALPSVDGVVFYLPPEDDVLGWDYPRMRDLVNARGIPHLVIRDDASAGDLPAEAHQRIEEFIGDLKR